MSLLTLSTWLAVTAWSSLTMAQGVSTALTNFISEYGFPINIDVFASTPENYTGVQWVSELNDLDAPKVFPINDTTYQWWWFDVVSPDAKSSIVMIFFTATTDGFALLPESVGATSLTIASLLPNGSMVAEYIPASAAVVASNGLLGNGAAGSWIGAGGSFAGTPNLSEYIVSIDTTGVSSVSFGVQGTLTFKSTAPGHYGCSTSLAAGQDLHVLPHIGWANAVPSSTVTGTMTIAGQTFDFTDGLGYHDQNWADVPFVELVQSWYWGHFTLGPYTVVVFDGISAQNGDEYAVGYVSLNDVELVSACGVGTAIIRPVNGTWPAHAGDAPATELTITVPLSNGQTLNANATYAAFDQTDPGLYYRGLVDVTGYVGTSNYTGIGMFEQFRLS